MPILKQLGKWLLLPILLIGTPGQAAAPAVIYGVEIPPYIMATPDGATGVIVEIVHTAFSHLGEPAQVQIVPWARGFELIKTQKGTGIIPTIRTAEREKQMLFPKHPVFIFSMSFFARSNAKTPWSGDLSTLQHLRFVKLRGAAFAPAFDEAYQQKRIQVDEANSFASALRMVAANHADIAAVPLLAGQALLRAEGLSDQLVALTPVVHEQAVYLALADTPTNAALLPKLNRVLAKMWKDGTIKTISDRWRGNDWRPNRIPTGATTPR